jgi:5'-AMP-activated protein kinase regulatory beta subunit
MPGTICSDCGNCHFGPCATEETCFVWTPEGREIPNEVLISGSWKKWQILEKLSKEVKETGETFFRINLTLLTGTYEYKFVVDGEWRYDPTSPVVDDQHGSYNNFVKVRSPPARSTPRRCSSP